MTKTKLTCKECNKSLVKQEWWWWNHGDVGAKKMSSLKERKQSCPLTAVAFECLNGCLDGMNPNKLIKLGYTYFQVKRIRGD